MVEGWVSEFDFIQLHFFHGDIGDSRKYTLTLFAGNKPFYLYQANTGDQCHRGNVPLNPRTYKEGGGSLPPPPRIFLNFNIST